MSHLLIIGSPSLDTLHFANQSTSTAGGAGMYTAMAARRSGARVSLFAPRPKPMPEKMQAISERLEDWIGPTVLPGEMPRFHIAHEGDKATYLEVFIGAESQLDPELLPKDLSAYDCVHVIPLGDARKQQEFLCACRLRGAGFLSAGTCLEDVRDRSEVVKTNLEQADVFFMNEEEAGIIFGTVENAKIKPGKLLFITLGEKGAMVVQGEHQRQLNAVPAKRLDPTGAGDTFCGAALAHLVQGEHPVMAARWAMALAAQEIEHVGPTALLWDEPPPGIALDERARINEGHIEKIAKVIQSLSAAAPFDFVGDDFPPPGHPAALDFFFASTLQQFGFWEEREGRYDQPLVAVIDGDRLKGSAYLDRAFLRPLRDDPAFYTPVRQASLTRQEMMQLFQADDGSHPMPALELHLRQAQVYGRDMRAMGITPQDIVQRSRNTNKPLLNFLRSLDHIGGYKEDPLRKKSNLLALCLNQRPEKFLHFGDEESVQPVVDYHGMRSALRIGLVDVLDEKLKGKLAERRILSTEEEWAVRYAVYRAQQKVVEVSGKGMGAVDWFFFAYMRSHCLEMSEPLCNKCAADLVCAHRKELFQPVIRTTFY